MDKSAPVLLGSEPVSGAVNVPPGNSVTLYFSEPVVKPQAGEAIFISPRPSADPKVKWRSRSVTVVLPDSFKSNQTYTISAGTSIKDLRGNQLDSTLTVAFSTGAVMATGRTAGQIINDKGQPQPNLMVALYHPAELEAAESLDSVWGRYVAQTNAEGFFSIGYLPQERFHLIAYDDKNHNGRFNPGRERFAVPDRYITVGAGAPLEELMLTVTEQDTTSVEILAATHTAEGLLRLRLSRAIDIGQLRENPQWCVLTSADSSAFIPAAALLEADDKSQAVLSFYPGVLSEGDYGLSLTYESARPPITFPAVTVLAQEDKSPPELVRYLPDDIPRFADEIKIEMVFSEPLDSTVITPETFLLWLLPEEPVSVTADWPDPLTLQLTPDTIVAGGRYRLDITEFELADRAGNRLGDSLRVHKFSTIDADSLGSISGEISIDIDGKKNDPVMLTLAGVSGRQSFVLTSAAGAFGIDLPAGKYLISGFIDTDGDRLKSGGSADPYMLAETMAAFPDTVTVRARFETAGVQIEFK